MHEQPEHNYDVSNKDVNALSHEVGSSSFSLDELADDGHPSPFSESYGVDQAAVSYRLENTSDPYFAGLNVGSSYERHYNLHGSAEHSFPSHQRLGSELNPSSKSIYYEKNVVMYEDENGERHKGTILHKSYSMSSHCDEYEVQRADTSRTVDTIGLADIEGAV